MMLSLVADPEHLHPPVAEMHGELIEFNERLHRALIAKEALVSQMRQELIDLRGPVPGDLSQTSEDQSLSDFEISNRALINVWIPSVFLRGKSANAFHVYQNGLKSLCLHWAFQKFSTKAVTCRRVKFTDSAPKMRPHSQNRQHPKHPWSQFGASTALPVSPACLALAFEGHSEIQGSTREMNVAGSIRFRSRDCIEEVKVVPLEKCFPG
uniref:Uncharacterized protein n=1 Tax=Sphaerodactylus townsendi TaxID=933632 RepID=A0ACB8FLV8_9SAUR